MQQVQLNLSLYEHEDVGRPRIPHPVVLATAQWEESHEEALPGHL